MNARDCKDSSPDRAPVLSRAEPPSITDPGLTHGSIMAQKKL